MAFKKAAGGGRLKKKKTFAILPAGGEVDTGTKISPTSQTSSQERNIKYTGIIIKGRISRHTGTDF